MRNAFLIAAREYLENAKTKGFWISIIALPVILMISLAAPAFLQDKALPTRYFVIIDPAQAFEPHLVPGIENEYLVTLNAGLEGYLREYSLPDKLAQAQDELRNWYVSADAGKAMVDLSPYLKAGAPDFSPPKRPFELVPLPESVRDIQDPVAIIEKLRPALRGESLSLESGIGVPLFALIYYPDPEVSPEAPIQYWSSNPGEDSLRQKVESVANQLARTRAFSALGMDIKSIESTLAIQVPFKEFDARKDKGEEQVRLTDKIRQWAPSAFVYLLFISLFAVMQMLLNSTIEEKSNRLLEILLSSVRPIEIMIGKLVGNGLAGLTLVGVWVLLLAGFGIFRLQGDSAISDSLSSAITSSNLIPAFLLYFILGFLLYSGLFLMIGSLCQTVKDAQSYTGFFMIVMMVPLMTMFIIPRDPNGVLAVTLSWIPFYTPFAMLNRLSGNPPVWEIIGTSILCLVTIAIILFFASRVFKNSIIASPPSNKPTHKS